MKTQHANEARPRRLRNTPRDIPRERWISPPRDSAAQAASLWQELTTGAVVGVFACLALTWALGVPAEFALFAAVLGVCAGGVIGLLIWIGSATLPDDPVLPPAPGQEREPPRRWR